MFEQDVPDQIQELLDEAEDRYAREQVEEAVSLLEQAESIALSSYPHNWVAYTRPLHWRAQIAANSNRVPVAVTLLQRLCTRLEREHDQLALINLAETRLMLARLLYPTDAQQGERVAIESARALLEACKVDSYALGRIPEFVAAIDQFGSNAHESFLVSALEAANSTKHSYLSIAIRAQVLRFLRPSAGQAETILGDAMEMVSAVSKPIDSDWLAALLSLANAAAIWGALDRFREIEQRLATAGWDRHDPEVHYALLMSEMLLAASQDTRTAFETARRAYEVAIEHFGATDRTEEAVHSLVELADRAGEPEAQIFAFESLIKFNQAVGRPLDLNQADVWSRLAYAYDKVGNYGASLEAYTAAHELFAQLLGDADPRTVHELTQVAELERVVGRLDDAREHFEQALAVQEAKQRSDGVTAFALNNLGLTLMTLGESDRALACLERGLALRIELFGPDSSVVARSRIGLASFYVQVGRFDDSAVMLDALEAADADAHRLQIALGRALIHMGRRQAEQALPFLESVRLALPDGLAPADHAYQSLFLWSMRAHAVAGNQVSAMEAARSLIESIRAMIREFNRIQESELETSMSMIGEAIAIWARALLAEERVGADIDAGALLNAILQWKGMTTRFVRDKKQEWSRSQQLWHRGGHRVREAAAELRRLKNQLQALQAGDDAVESASLRQRIRKLERDFGGDGVLAVTDIDHRQIQTLLPRDVAVLEFIAVPDAVRDYRPHGQRVADRYAVFFISGGDEPGLKLVDLGLQRRIDTALNELRASLMSEPATDREPLWSRRASFVSNRLVSPIWQLIEQVPHLLVAPDGALSALPFELLVAPDGARLVDCKCLSYITSVNELRHRNEFRMRGGPSLVLGGPDFELAGAHPEGMKKQVIVKEQGLATLQHVSGEIQFEPLLHARLEAREIAQVLDTVPLTDRWALEQELDQTREPEIMHLATHGFFVPGDDNEALLDLEANNLLALQGLAKIDDARRRTGLAFAGANAALRGLPLPAEAGNAIAYAWELEMLDLRGTDLVVLSSCRTAVGDIVLGDGMRGVGRAFMSAGAQSIVSALWDVPDESTRRIMLRFYRELLTGKSRIESLRLAQDAVRQDFPMEPVHWAGFVLYGRTGPLRRFEPIDDLTVGTLNLSEFRTDGQLNLTAVARHIVDGPDLGEAWQPTALELLTMIQRELLDDKDRPFALHLLADLANRIGDNDQAIQWFGEIAGDASVDEQARLSAAYNRAKAFMEAERFNESLTAHTQLRESFELSKELAANVINNIGVCQLFLGDTAGAFESFSLILKQPDFPHEIRTLARVNRVGSYPQDHTDEALAEINAILAQPEALSDEQMSGLKRQREQIRRRLGRA